MSALRRFLSRLANFVSSWRDDERLREEIEEHIALQTEENIRVGLSPTEARRQAMLKFGGVEAMKQDYRAERGLPLIENLMRDGRFALRLLRKSPGFTGVAVLTLAMAIGANAVVFAVLNALILRPLNVPQAQSLYATERTTDKWSYESYPNYLDLRERNRSFDGLAAYNISQAGLDTGENPSRASVVEVSGNYFDVLGIQPYLGRFFHGSDEHGPNSAPYIVLTYAYWHSHFQDDRDVVGRTVQLNNHPFTVVGVAPPEFRGTLFGFLSRFLCAHSEPGTGGWAESPERSQRPLGHFDHGASEGGSHSGAGDCGSQLDWLISEKELSQRRGPNDLFIGASQSC